MPWRRCGREATALGPPASRGTRGRLPGVPWATAAPPRKHTAEPGGWSPRVSAGGGAGAAPGAAPGAAVRGALARSAALLWPGPRALAALGGGDAGRQCAFVATKALFFLRPPGAGPAELLCGDLPAEPLPHFAALVEEVIVPILTNRKNHQGWPRVVSQDIIHHVHRLKNTVFKVVGQVKGKTLLPLPAGSEGIEDIDPKNEKYLQLINKSLIHATESAIIDWSQQIQRVLRRESSEPLLQGRNPTPKVELEFWKSRCEDLEGIYSQLTSRKVSNMVEVLHRVQSIYVPAFQNMLLDVEAGEKVGQLWGYLDEHFWHF
uniref:Dynein heavy chain tail domain-containing protein n=1 Tax=Malurus cyaneus samueli TaxID=2593467 RepID=A0A8C5TQE7_9PASS